MKKLSLLLLVVTLPLAVFSQSQFAGEWFAVRSPASTAACCYERTLSDFTIYTDGEVVGSEFTFSFLDIDTISGFVSPRGKLVTTTSAGIQLTLTFSSRGRGTGVGKWTDPNFPGKTLRETFALYRRNVR